MNKKKDVINGDDDEDDGEHIRAAMATRQKNLKKKSGGFQSMGMSTHNTSCMLSVLTLLPLKRQSYVYNIVRF